MMSNRCLRHPPGLTRYFRQVTASSVLQLTVTAMTASGEDRPARGRNLLEELTEIAKNFEKMERKVRMLTVRFVCPVCRS